MAGSGGQASAIMQELVKDWEDSNGRKHPGVYDDEYEFSVLWAESYRNAVSGCLKAVEPRKFRNALFEAAKVLVPQGGIKFSPPCPKYDTIVLDDGTEKKLSKGEMASLIQLDLMKEEVVAMVRIKTPGTGNITYQLPPEKRGKMHDDRNYVFVLTCWRIKCMREDEEFGDGKAIDYSGFFNQKIGTFSSPKKDPWLEQLTGNRQSGSSKKNKSPFQGPSPFK